jgi:hypothetical protein
MIVYEFYWYNPAKGYELLGILPERRKNPERITNKSIMGWSEKVFGTFLSPKDITFIQVKMNRYYHKFPVNTVLSNSKASQT